MDHCKIDVTPSFYNKIYRFSARKLPNLLRVFVYNKADSLLCPVIFVLHHNSDMPNIYHIKWILIDISEGDEFYMYILIYRTSFSFRITNTIDHVWESHRDHIGNSFRDYATFTVLKAYYAWEMLSFLFFVYLVTVFIKFSFFIETNYLWKFFFSFGNWSGNSEWVFCIEVNILLCLHYATFMSHYCMFSISSSAVKHLTCP
jgi:hypothetical protein